MAVDSQIDSILNAYGASADGMPSQSDVDKMMNSLGVNMSDPNGMFSWPNLLGGTIFGLIGFCAFKYGWKEKSYKQIVIGLILMIYPFFTPQAWMLYLVGIVITSLLYFWRD